MMCLKVFSLKNSNFKNPISALFKQTMITIFGFLDSFLRPIIEKKIFEKKLLNFHEISLIKTSKLLNENQGNQMENNSDAEKDKENQIEIVNEKTDEELNKEITELNRNSLKLNAEIKNKQLEIRNFEDKMTKIEILYDQKVDTLENKIEDMTNKLLEGTKVIADLSNYKKSYDQIHSSK